MTADNLALLLSMLVPLRIHEIRDLDDQARRALVTPEMADWISVESATLLVGGAVPAERPERRRALTAIVTGLAVGAYQPDGVHFGTAHWVAAPGAS